MPAENLYLWLQNIDNLHALLQFFIPFSLLAIAGLLKSDIRFFGFVSVALLGFLPLVIIHLDNLSNSEFVLSVAIGFLWCIIYWLGHRFSLFRKTFFVVTILSLLSFSLSQLLLGGCWIHYTQNYFSEKYLGYTWYTPRLFGSDYFPVLGLKYIYFFSSLGLFFLAYSQYPKLAKKVIHKQYFIIF